MKVLSIKKKSTEHQTNLKADLISAYFFEIFTSELIKSESVKISSFGTFKVNKKKERIGRNPKTKVETIISARKIIKFKPSLDLKNKINN